MWLGRIKNSVYTACIVRKRQTKEILNVYWKKLMVFCVKGVVYLEILQRNQTVNAELYSQHLARVVNALATKRPKLLNILLLHDMTRPHIAPIYSG